MMNVEIVKSDESGDYNKFGQKVIDCRLCGGKTTMTGTKLCDPCWELEVRIEANTDVAVEVLRTMGYRVEHDY